MWYLPDYIMLSKEGIYLEPSSGILKRVMNELRCSETHYARILSERRLSKFIGNAAGISKFIGDKSWKLTMGSGFSKRAVHQPQGRQFVSSFFPYWDVFFILKQLVSYQRLSSPKEWSEWSKWMVEVGTTNTRVEMEFITHIMDEYIISIISYRRKKLRSTDFQNRKICLKDIPRYFYEGLMH